MPDVTFHLRESSTIETGTRSPDVKGPWVSIIIDGTDLTFFGEPEQLLGLGAKMTAEATRLCVIAELGAENAQRCAHGARVGETCSACAGDIAHADA